MSNPNNDIEITYRGWAGHFICAHKCRFRLNTLVRVNERRVVVSTVGLMENALGNGFEEIGLDRHFETMAFEAKPDENKYWDADVSREVSFPGDWSFPTAGAEGEHWANRNHARVVEWVKEVLIYGENQ